MENLYKKIRHLEDVIKNGYNNEDFSSYLQGFLEAVGKMVSAYIDYESAAALLLDSHSEFDLKRAVLAKREYYSCAEQLKDYIATRANELTNEGAT